MKRVMLCATVCAVCALCGAGMAGEGWQGPQRIEQGSSNGWFPQIACGEDGSAAAVFNLWEGANFRIFGNRYAPASGWGQAVIIDEELPLPALPYPQVAIGPSGDAIAAFVQQSPGGIDTVYARRCPPAGTWGPFVPLNPGQVQNSNSPCIAYSAHGSAVAAFCQENASGDWNLCANVWSGSSWGGATPALDPNALGSNAKDPWAAMDPQGRASVVYAYGPGLNDRIYESHYDGTTWSRVQIDAGKPPTIAGESHVAYDPQGNAIAVFMRSEGWMRVYASRRAAGNASWSAPVTIDAGGNHANLPRVAVDAQGNAVAVFTQTLGSYAGIYANRYDAATGTWGTAERIDNGMAESAGDPQVAFDSRGNAIAVFSQFDACCKRIYANRCVNGAWGTAQTIDNGPIGFGKNAEDPQIACDGQGNAIAVFNQSDGTVNRIYANRYAGPTPTPTATPPVDLTANKAAFSTSDSISVTADVWPISTPCYPFVRIVMADGSTLYYQRGVGFLASPTPYLGFATGAITVGAPITGYPALSANFSGIATGTYYLEGGAVDATQTTSASNLVYVGTVDTNALTVQ